MWITTIWTQANQPLLWTVVVTAAVIAAYTDIKGRRIPNILTGPMLLAGLVFSSVNCGWAGLGDSAVAMVVLALPYVLLFLFAGGGAGDAKLMAAFGAWLGLINGLVALAAVSIAAIIAAILQAIFAGQVKKTATNIGGIVSHAMLFVLSGGRMSSVLNTSGSSGDISHMQKMPYGVSIFAGICIAAGGALLWRI